MTPRVAAVLVAAVVGFALAGEAGPRSAESVTCSTTTPAQGGLDLTGSWRDAGGRPYSFLQRGTCLWWVGGAADANVFFGTVFGSTVNGIWADVSRRSTGGITLVVSTPTRLLQRGSAGRDFRPRRFTRRAGGA